jgi:SAM-dependent methyltransferase
MRRFDWFRRTPRDDELVDDDPIWEGDTPYRIIGGRRRKAGIPYLVPWDIEEHNRLDFQHFMLRQAFRGNYAAPIGTPLSVLDVGSGTGRWAIEMANLFPQANVIGLDINPPPIDVVAEGNMDTRPPNYSFVAANALDRLPFADRTFDFVHMRALVTAIPHDRWPFVIGELARVARQNGWVESLEVTHMQGGGPAVDQLMSWLDATLARRGVRFLDGGNVGAVMASVGLANITSLQFAMRCGETGGRIGKMLAVDNINVLGGIGGMTVAQGITSAEQFSQVLQQASRDLADPTRQCVMPLYIAFGQQLH